MNYCSNCGKKLNENADFCTNCGVRVINTKVNKEIKSKLVAGLLGIFLGSFGVHNFYLGYTNKAVTQLILTIVGYITFIFIVGFFFIAAASIWGFIEGIMILSGSINKDAQGNNLGE